jgi:hypothetical protein
MLRLNSRLLPCLEEALQTFVLETLNHVRSVTRYVTLRNLLHSTFRLGLARRPLPRCSRSDGAATDGRAELLVGRFSLVRGKETWSVPEILPSKLHERFAASRWEIEQPRYSAHMVGCATPDVATFRC